MNPANKLMATVISGVFLTFGTNTQAAVITFEPINSSVMVGEVIEVKLVGSGFVEGEGGTYGGGASVFWNPSLLMLESYDTSVFGGDKSLATSNTTTVIDNTSGQLRNLSVASLFSAVSSNDFDIAILTFKGLAAGETSLAATLGQFQNGFDIIWTDSSFLNPIQVNPQFVNGSLSVTAVPLPAAVWMFGAGLAGMGGSMNRRKKM